MSNNSREAGIANFSDVDSTNQAEQFIAFVDRMERLPQAMEFRERSYQLLKGHPGETAVDVGCGTGRVVAELSERGIRAIGVDISQQMIMTARKRFPTEDYRLAAATSLPFADCSLNLYRAERVYQYLEEPAAALREAWRVLAPGGRIVLLDPDGDMWAIDADDQEMTRVMMRALSNSVANRWVGRRYYSLLQDVGFVEVSVEVKTGIFTGYDPDTDNIQRLLLSSMANSALAAGVLTHEEVDGWLAEQKQRGQQGRFFLAMPVFIASARRP